MVKNETYSPIELKKNCIYNLKKNKPKKNKEESTTQQTSIFNTILKKVKGILPIRKKLVEYALNYKKASSKAIQYNSKNST